MSYFDDASLVFIPSGTKTSKAYSVKPIDGTGDLTFSRSNATATRVNSAGLIEKVRTNLFVRSEEFDNASWSKLLVNVTANAAANPLNGASTAENVVPNTTSGGHYVSQSQSVTAGVPFTVSVYAKANGYDWIYLFADGSGSGQYRLFNVANGTLGLSSGTATPTITAVGNGWYRCTMSWVPSVSGSIIFQIAVLSSNSVAAFAGDGTSGALIYGAQLETGDIATPYIATTTAAVSVGPVANVPRLDYLNSSCPRLLLEPQRQNLALFSESFDNAAWTKGAATITANAVTSPDGYTNADSFLPTATTSAHSVDPATLINLGGVVGTFSVFAKYNGYHLSLSIAGSSTNWTGCVFDLQNGIARTPQKSGSQVVCTSKIEDYGNGWYRCSISYTPYAGGAFYTYIGATSTNNATLGNLGLQSFAANGTSGVYLYGAQVETSASYATSYIPTLGAAVTRGADAAYKGSISSLIGATEGVLFVDFIKPPTGTPRTKIARISALLTDGGNSFVNSINLDVETNGNLRGNIVTGGVSQVDIQTAAYAAGTRIKMALAYKANDVVLYINGTQIGTDTSATIPVCTAYEIASYETVNSSQTNYVSQALLFKTRLTDAQLAELTSL